MIKTSKSPFEKQYIAWDNEDMNHVTRFGVSKANAIARLKAAHSYIKDRRKIMQIKMEAKRKSIAVSVAARTFEEIAEEMDAEIRKMKDD